MPGIFVTLPYSENFLSIHGNTSTADYDSMSFFCSVLNMVKKTLIGSIPIID
jgi:hypothetical protein